MYESPINVIYEQAKTRIEHKLDADVLTIVQNYGINVDKEELIRALQYDRQQYEKGYEDAKAEQKWILCSERMPEEGRECWITAKTKTNEVYRGTFTEFYGVRHDVGFICGDGFMWWNTAKAWMYFENPEPYKGENE